MKNHLVKIGVMGAADGQAEGAAGWHVLFKAGWVELEDGENTRFLVDQEAYNEVLAYFSRRGNDIVFDYEHASLGESKAPAAGWVKALAWDPEQGILGAVEWTDEASGYIERGEYRYFSPVFYIRGSDSRLVGIHSFALTNTPKTNDLVPLAAKLAGQDFFDDNANKEEKPMNEFIEKLIARLKSLDGDGKDLAAPVVAKLEALDPKAATDDVVVSALADSGIFVLREPKGGQAPVVAKEIVDALELDGESADTSAVVASIHALKHGGKAAVDSRVLALEAKLAERDAKDAVVAARQAGKISPDMEEWAMAYAKNDLKGFNLYVAKAPQVVPVDPLPGQRKKADPVADEAVMAVAKFFGNTAEDLKKYAGLEGQR